MQVRCETLTTQMSCTTCSTVRSCLIALDMTATTGGAPSEDMAALRTLRLLSDPAPVIQHG